MDDDSTRFEQLDLDDMGVDTGGELHPPRPPKESSGNGLNEVDDYNQPPQRVAEKYGRQLLSRIHLIRLEQAEDERQILDELVTAILILARRFDTLASQDEPNPENASPPSRDHARQRGSLPIPPNARISESTGEETFHTRHPHPAPQNPSEGKSERTQQEPAADTRQMPAVKIHAHRSVKPLHSREEIIRNIRTTAKCETANNHFESDMEEDGGQW